MAVLYILSEGARDELFYDILAERITGNAYESSEDLRLRHGANWKTALAGGRLLLNRVKHWTEPQEIAVILAIDNDRSSGHPGSASHLRPLVGMDLKKPPRYPTVVQMIEDALGSDRSQWPVDVALAMPVEMIESWVLLFCEPQRPALPIFAEASQPGTRAYYGQTPPPQLKDLCKSEAAGCAKSLEEFFWHAAEQDIEAAAAASSSLLMFVDQLRSWRKYQS